MYIVRVAAINDAGDGVYSDPLTASSTEHSETAAVYAATSAGTEPSYSDLMTRETPTDHGEVLLCRMSIDTQSYGNTLCAQQPRLHCQTGDLGDIAGVRQNRRGLCQGGKSGTGKLYTDVCLCGSAHTSGCVVDGLGAKVAH